MRLADLHPWFVGSGGEGVTAHGQPMPRRHGVGVAFDCPCGCGQQLYVPFRNPLDGGPPTCAEHPSWQREGETFETLTLRPSILRVRWKDQAGQEHGRGWHGFITRGQVETV